MQPPINVDENPAIVANHHIHHNQPLIDVDQFMRERINGSLLKLMHGFFWGFSYIFNYRLVCWDWCKCFSKQLLTNYFKKFLTPLYVKNKKPSTHLIIFNKIFPKPILSSYYKVKKRYSNLYSVHDWKWWDWYFISSVYATHTHVRNMPLGLSRIL